MKVLTVIGTRPEIIRLSRIIATLDEYVEHIVVHTGQNYDYELSQIFFDDLSLRKPDYFLQAADATPASTVASIIGKIDAVYADERPDATLVFGDSNSGLAAYDLMNLIEAPITTVCIGEAASMAAILFLAGEERIIFPGSRIMIHDPSPGGGSLQGMKPDEIQEQLEDLKRCRDRLCSIIAEKTNKTMDEIRTKTRKDSYFTAEEAISFHLATKIAERI